MVKLENYDIAFSFDDASENTSDNNTDNNSTNNLGNEVALLVVENDDLPKFDGVPYSAIIKDDILSASIIISFKNDQEVVEALECINLPHDLQQALEKFDHIWFCSLGDEEVVFEHHIPLSKSH